MLEDLAGSEVASDKPCLVSGVAQSTTDRVARALRPAAERPSLREHTQPRRRRLLRGRLKQARVRSPRPTRK